MKLYIIDGNSFKEKYEFNRRLFNLSSEPAKLNSPYIVKWEKMI